MNHRALKGLAAGAAAVTVLLTAAAFWLSYEHLHDVAAANGLQRSPARAWAWPATIDLFIIVGELLILRASLAHRVDRWAIGLTVAGSGGSIALNVAGVGTHADPLEYIVAAIPPTAALLAFGTLARQMHEALARLADTTEATTEVTTGPATLPRVIPVPVEVPIVPELAPVPLPPMTTETTSRPTAVLATNSPREVVTSLVTPTTTEMTPGQRRQAARRLNRQHIRETGRPVTVDALRAALNLSRRDAAQLRREVIAPT